MTDLYLQAENLGRAKAKYDYDHSAVPCNYVFTEDKMNKIDSFLTAYTQPKEKTYAIEIKNRDIPINQYAEAGYILELIKYDALMEAYRNSGYTPIYLNYFQDGRIAWDITNLDITDRVITKSCTKTTATNYGERIDKKVILLHPNEGKVKWYQN